MSSFFPMMFALQPAQAVSLGILSSQAVILAVLDKIAGYFVQYPSFRAPGAFARAWRSRRPSNWFPPGIYRRGLASAGLVLGCVFSRPGTCRGEGRPDLGEIYLLRALLWGGTLQNPANTTRKACGPLVARSAGKGRRWPPAESRTTPTPVQTVSGPAPVERRARSGRDEAFSRDLANRTRSFRVPRNPRLVTFGGWGSGSGPEFRTVPLHPWNPKGNKNPPPAYRLGKKCSQKVLPELPKRSQNVSKVPPGAPRRRPERPHTPPERPRSVPDTPKWPKCSK